MVRFHCILFPTRLTTSVFNTYSSKLSVSVCFSVQLTLFDLRLIFIPSITKSSLSLLRFFYSYIGDSVTPYLFPQSEVPIKDIKPFQLISFFFSWQYQVVFEGGPLGPCLSCSKCTWHFLLQINSRDKMKFPENVRV